MTQVYHVFHPNINFAVQIINEQLKCRNKSDELEGEWGRVHLDRSSSSSLLSVMDMSFPCLHLCPCPHRSHLERFFDAQCLRMIKQVSLPQNVTTCN